MLIEVTVLGDDVTTRLRPKVVGSSLFSLILFTLSAPRSAYAGLDVPLFIQELLPANDNGGINPTDITGLNRTDEPVTSGIPLKQSDGITDVSQLAVQDTVAGSPVNAQFRVLRCYQAADGSFVAPGNNNTTCSTAIQWVLVDLQASVTANGTNTQYHLVTGTNPATGALATDRDGSITVGTGTATFSILKAKQNVIDSAAIGATTIMSAGHPGGISYTGDNGTVFNSTNDPSSTATIEENGPMKAVVKETGRLKDGAGNASFGYTVRLTFYKNKSYVKAQVSIENAWLDSLTRKSVDNGIEVVIPLALTNTKTFQFATKTSSITGAVQAGKEAYLFQAYTTHNETSAPATGKIFNFNDLGAPYTVAQAFVRAPGTSSSSSEYPPELVGKILILSVDDGPDRSITFNSSDFADPNHPKAKEVASIINATLRSTAGREAESFIEGAYSRDPGLLVIREGSVTVPTKGGKPSVQIKSGDANPILGFADNQRFEGRNGYVAVNGTTTLHEFGGPEDFARGFADLKDSAGKGLTIAVYNFDTFFPNAIALNDGGQVAYEIFTPRNPRKGLYFDWEVNETRDLMLDFHATQIDPEATYYRIQYPLFARAPFEQYRDTGAFLGRTRLVSFTEMQNYYDTMTTDSNIESEWSRSNEGTYGISSYTAPNLQNIRFRSFAWGTPGSTTNTDQTVPRALTFLQTGKGGYFLTLNNVVRFIVDNTLGRSDGGDRTTWPKKVQGTVPPPLYGYVNGYHGKWEDEHENFIAVPFFYYLTGNQAIYDALVDFGEYEVREVPFPSNCSLGQRSPAQRAKWNSLIWRTTGYSGALTQMDGYADNYICAMIVDGSNLRDGGMDPDRGFPYQYTTFSPTLRQDHRPITDVRWEGMYELWLALPGSDSRKEDLGDRLLGQSYWVAKEYYFDRHNSLCRSFGPPPGGSEYFFDVTPDSNDDAFTDSFAMEDFAAEMALGYQMTKDPDFLNYGRRVVAAMGNQSGPTCLVAGHRVATAGSPYSNYAHWTANDFIYTDLHRGDFGVLFFNDDPNTYGGLQVVGNGNGSYRISWAVPAGAKSYQIKYGPQIMVPNLDFDKYNRTYQYDPGMYDNFWSGNGGAEPLWSVPALGGQPRNVSDEPTPGQPGTLQSYTISGLDPDTNYHFAVRIETDGSGSPPPTPVRPTAPRLL